MRHILFRDGATRSGEVVYIDPTRWQPPAGVIAIEYPPALGTQPLDYELREGELVYGPEKIPPRQPGYKELREQEYRALGLGNQLDAVYKGMDVIIPALVEGRALTPQEAALLLPDKTQPVDTPAGWLGKVKDIKERFPKK